MTLELIGELLKAITIHYPKFRDQIVVKKEIKDEKGKSIIQEFFDSSVLKEWNRIIGFLDYDEALARLDAWMDAGNSNPPRAVDFKKVPEQPKRPSIFHAETKHHFRLEFWVHRDNYGTVYENPAYGQIVDEEGRRYADPNNPDEWYHYDAMGRIADSRGKIVVI